MDQYELVELQRKARELETEQAAAQALRHQLMQLKDELLEAVCRAEEYVTPPSQICFSASLLSRKPVPRHKCICLKTEFNCPGGPIACLKPKISVPMSLSPDCSRPALAPLGLAAQGESASGLLRSSETALHRAQRQGQIRIMCALQQQWKAVHLERSWAVRKQRESLLDLKRMVAVRVSRGSSLTPLPTGRLTVRDG
jgi:hypothetical protein